ncbi:MAG: GGDEF domain-containing protein [Alphaproteobacteria bacterium]|nr:MAG: GGDEF domain-containing protein [Alphaproteobacteria bacterium]
MALLKERGIRQIPQNYTIWYEYLTESNPDLIRAVNRLIAENGKFSEKIAREIYSEFFTFEKEGKAIQETNRLVQKSMDSVIGDLEMSTSEFSHYGEKLTEFAAMAASLPPEKLKALVADIVKQTNSVSENTRVLRDGLTNAAREIAALKRRLEDVQKEALIDTLTGIANRKSFDAELSKVVSDCQETHHDLSLIMTDIDHFKAFNDTHGHPFGDQVLKLVAQTLDHGVDRKATTARYGGEEFGIILPQTSLNDAVDLANDLRVAVSSKRLVKRSTGDDVGKITMSFGVASYQPCEDTQTFICRADEALYSAKNSGRNRVRHMEASFAVAG